MRAAVVRPAAKKIKSAVALSTPAPAVVVRPAVTARWYLGFDCATKTLAFSLARIDMAAFEARRADLTRRLAALRALPPSELPAHAAEVAALDRDSRLIELIDGEVVDLFPGRADKSIHTVERIRALAAYVQRRVLPALEKHKAAATVLVEFQMGVNAKSRMIAAALIAIFHAHDVHLVGPSLKNTISLGDEGQMYKFVERYSTAYPANKAHAAHNFAVVERAFGSKIPMTRTAALRGHIADSFMQILGWLRAGGDKNGELQMF